MLPLVRDAIAFAMGVLCLILPHFQCRGEVRAFRLVPGISWKEDFGSPTPLLSPTMPTLPLKAILQRLFSSLF